MDLTAKPFYLDNNAIAWVRSTLAGMSIDEKIGQLFCLVARDGTEEEISGIFRTMKPGGIMYRQMERMKAQALTKIIGRYTEVPMLIAANLEKGGNGVVTEGTSFSSPMEIAATDDEVNAYRLGLVCGREAKTVGCNWAFAPVVDIDMNFRNPITNTRTYGSDPERVCRMSVQYIRGVQECGLAACIKHFPGDGVDERDHHLVTSVNDLSCEEWDATYGVVYKACINAGAMTAMIGQILQPAYTRHFNPDIDDKDMLPATLSYELATKLLKEKLGFNGLVTTDASTMAGMLIPMPRWEAVPKAIAAGCDMFLFSRNMEEDFEYMKNGVEHGVVTPRRLNEAVMKILALKVALKLHDVSSVACVSLSACAAEHKAWAEACADKAITLVKEEKNVLPLSPTKYHKVLFYGIESEQGSSYSARSGVVDLLFHRLKQEGLEIDYFDANKALEGRMTPFRDFVHRYDLIIYVANMATKSNQTTVRIEWAQPMGANVPVYISSIPTIFISVENPYHLLDVPRVRTFINTYASSDIVLNALVDKLMGRSAFQGINPVDPFCGKWDARL